MLLTGGTRRRFASGAPAVRAPLYVGAILVLLAAAYWPTVRELSGFGGRTDGQFLIVFCAFAGMVWARRHLLEEIPLRPFWPALAALLGLVLAWLVGEIALVRALTDASVVLMVPVAIVALCGLQWARALALPLALVVLAIPLEQPLAPILAEWTAEATIFLLRAVGIPVVREGVYFTIPSGRWVVADACGGVKYLTSCLIVALVLAPVLFDSTRRKAAFVLGALALAIVGNWLRAFLTVLGAHLTNNEILRDDHSTFGWFVYGVLFVLYCAAWWRYRDDNPDAIERAPAHVRAASPAPGSRIAGVAAVSAAIVLAGPVLSHATSAPGDGHFASVPQVPEAGGWQRASRPATQWSPQLQSAAAATVQSFQKDGRTVDVFIGVFGEERWDAKLVSVNNAFVESGSDWVVASRGLAAAQVAGRELSATRALIAGPQSRVVAWQWYWVNGEAKGRGVEAKLAQLRSRLVDRQQKSAWIAISVPTDGSPRAERELREFLTEMGPAIHDALSSQRETRRESAPVAASRTEG